MRDPSAETIQSVFDEAELAGALDMGAQFGCDVLRRYPNLMRAATRVFYGLAMGANVSERQIEELTASFFTVAVLMVRELEAENDPAPVLSEDT